MVVSPFLEGELGSFNLEDCTACSAPDDVQVGINIPLDVYGLGVCGERSFLGREGASEETIRVALG